MKTHAHAIEVAKKQGISMMDFDFVGTFGAWQNFSFPAEQLTKAVFADGSILKDRNLHRK